MRTRPKDAVEQRDRGVVIAWMLPALVELRGFSPPQLAAMLRTGGYAISDSQVYRLVQHAPRRYDRDLLAAMCRALGCELGDLLHYESCADDITVLPPRFRVP